MSEKLLSDKKKKWVKQFKPNQLKGKTVNYNAAVQSRYVRELNKLVHEMMTETEQDVKNLFKKPVAKEYFAEDESMSSQARILTNKLMKKFENLFDVNAKPMAEKMIKETDKASQAGIKGSLKELSGGLTLKTDIFTDKLNEIAKATITENVSLIKSISSNYLGKVQSAVMRSITTGNGLQDLIPFFQKQRGITQRHARNMALDQTRKAYNHINAERMKALGVEKFEWIHSGGGQKPRKLHQQMNGNIYRFDDPPIIDEKTGQRGLPGDAINCRCVMRAIVEFER